MSSVGPVPAPPTVRDVARRAGVSAMTVSRALRGDSGVSEATRERIVRIADVIGYRPSEAARNLRLGRSYGVVGLIVPNIGNPFYSQVALGVETTLAERGQEVLIANAAENPEQERRLAEAFAARRVDGIIAVPSTDDHRHFDPAALSGVRIVLAARPPRRIDVDAVLLDDFGGTFDAVTRLIGRGHRRIALLGLPEQAWTGAERQRGYLAAVRDAGLDVDPELYAHRQRTVEEAEAATRILLALPDPPTAIFAANNRNTIGAYRAVRGLDHPPELAGFDNFELADTLGVLRLIVDYDPREIGRRAAELLVSPMPEPVTANSARRVTIPTALVEFG